MKNKSINKIIFYAIVIFCISAFSCFPESYSKYIKKEEALVKSNIEIDQLYYPGKLSVDSDPTSTYEVANYIAKIDKSHSKKEYDDSQVIRVEIKNPKVENPTCQITSIDSNGTASFNGNNATITYTSSGEDLITIKYNCNVSDITINENGLDYIYTNIFVYEKFIPENNEYLYTKTKIDDVKKLLSDYYLDYPKPDIKQLILSEDAEDKYNKFQNWIAAYSSSLDDKYKSEILDYVNSVYVTEEDIKLSIKGLTVTHDTVRSRYIYQIDDNFLGYARTRYAYEGPGDLVNVIFSNDSLTPEESNEILRYYFETYGETSEEDINKIIKYVSSFGSLNYISKPNPDGTYNTIPGFIYRSDSGAIRISPSLMDYVNIFCDKKITIEFGSKGSMYNTYISNLYIYDFLTPELIEILENSDDIDASIFKNSSSSGSTTKTAYSDYFTIKDPNTGKYILVNVYSDGETNTCVEIIELGVAESLSITKIKNDINISITVSEQNIEYKSDIIDIISNLDNYLGTNYNEKIVDDLFLSPGTIGEITSQIEDSKVTISYTISESEDLIVEETEPPVTSVPNDGESTGEETETPDTSVPNDGESTGEETETPDTSTPNDGESTGEETETSVTSTPNDDESTGEETETSVTSTPNDGESAGEETEPPDTSTPNDGESTGEEIETSDVPTSENENLESLEVNTSI